MWQLRLQSLRRDTELTHHRLPRPALHLLAVLLLGRTGICTRPLPLLISPGLSSHLEGEVVELRAQLRAAREEVRAGLREDLERGDGARQSTAELQGGVGRGGVGRSFL